MEMDDWQLLNDYAERNSEEAFRALVDRYTGLAYHAALNRCGNPSLAEEIAQAVFIALARKAKTISRHATLSGWIFEATRFAALNLARAEARRKFYEQEAAVSESLRPDEGDSLWELIAPHLYEALDKLSQPDRDVLLIRFFQNKSHREIAGLLGISEDAAKARVSRAVERLRAIFARQGLATPSAALAVALSSSMAQAAPAGLSATIATAAIAKAAAGHGFAGVSAKGAFKWLGLSHSKAVAVIGAGFFLAAGGLIVIKAENNSVSGLVGQLEKQSGAVIVFDKRLEVPSALYMKNFTLPQALDRICFRAGGYWTVDYAIYDSSSALEKLKRGIIDANPLAEVGWTNLSRASHAAQPVFIPHGPMARGSAFMMGGPDPSVIAVMVDLGPDATGKWMDERNAGVEDDDLAETKVIDKAMADGEAEGALIPERLLAESDLVAKIHPKSPEEATPENAARIAKEIGAHWSKIYALRQSPLEGAGMRLNHREKEDQVAMPPRRPGMFEMNPDERDAHEQAVEAYKRQRAGN